jgi:phenylacetic acid degradation operon negative regulatory protein
VDAIRNTRNGDDGGTDGRPLSARSLIASLLLGMEHPVRAGADLVRWCGLFGVAAGTARVALSRMVDAGELRAHDGRYELVGRVRARSGEHDVARRPLVRRDWDGTWVVAVVTADARSSDSRGALRRELLHAHYAEQREGVWTRPDNVRGAVMIERDAQCRLWRARPDGDPVELAGALFAPAVWSARAVELDVWMQSAVAAIESDGDGDGAAIADGFLAGARVLAHLRADPLLPPTLVPGDFHGDALRRMYDDFQPRFDRAVAEWFRAARAPS